MNTSELAKQVEPIIRRLWPTISAELGGKPPNLQAAVLADLTAIWLAGHIVPGDPAATARKRDELLDLHVEAIRSLIPSNEPAQGGG